MDAVTEKRSFSARRESQALRGELGENLPVGEAPPPLLREGSLIVTACDAAVEELRAARRLIELLERENELLKDRLGTEKRTTSLLAELSESRRAENEALRDATAAKNETITAKEAVISSQEKLIERLKNKKSSPWRRLGDVLMGVAAGAILR